jgi:hypothetical protein
MRQVRRELNGGDIGKRDEKAMGQACRELNGGDIGKRSREWKGRDRTD